MRAAGLISGAMSGRDGERDHYATLGAGREEARAEMVKAFISSDEYRKRFGP